MKLKLAAALIAACVTYTANACTGISLTTTQDDYIQARTIEWGENDLNSKLVISPRQHTYTSIMPDQKKGLTWQSKYGFTGISVSDDRFIAEGVNEAGLSSGLFYFKNYGSLSQYDPKHTADNITDMDFVRWMLSQFSTVDEVEQAIANIKIVPVYMDAKGNPSPTAHWRVADKLGNNIVIEIMNNGQVSIHKNTAQVLTNAPDYQWHLTNLNNYINLHPGVSQGQKFSGVNAFSLGVGSGALGMPGDITPPSRFVRAAFFVNTAPDLHNGDEAVSQAFHILNNFDLPIGTEFNEKKYIPDLPSATQWTSVIDQTNGKLYYKTMRDSTIKKVDLSKINFNGSKEVTRPLDKGSFHVEDVTPVL
ncbi:choloylglycine hydrolase family protein [Photobacterium japonica]|uniref:linear amide C-N hydrolase n=1 Tax=Photobacterium japonica TaxID=2910235 RepID=UPI003D0F4EB7